MRYMMIYSLTGGSGETDGPPSQQDTEQMGAFIGEMAEKGVLITTDGLPSSAHGARLRKENGKYTVTDGPFTESKEIIAGFAIIDVPGKDEAMYWANRFLELVDDGVSEVRLMHDQPAYPPA